MRADLENALRMNPDYPPGFDLDLLEDEIEENQNDECRAHSEEDEPRD